MLSKAPGLVVPIPTRLLEESTCKVLVSIVISPVPVIAPVTSIPLAKSQLVRTSICASVLTLKTSVLFVSFNKNSPLSTVTVKSGLLFVSVKFIVAFVLLIFMPVVVKLPKELWPPVTA